MPLAAIRWFHHPLSISRPALTLGLLAAASLALMGGMVGCAAAGTLDREHAPDDFVLGVTVFAEPTDAPAERSDGRGLPRGLRPARYIVEADGVLRAAFGPAAAPTVYPPMTRQLSTSQRDDLWRLARSTGVFGDPASGQLPEGEEVGPVSSFEPPRGRVTALIESFAAGLRASRALGVAPTSSGSDSEPASPESAVRSLTDRLAELAWLPEAPVDVEDELRSRQAGEDR